jgi:dTDP-4-amino-4,6-dideoxygalactose transaminase
MSNALKVPFLDLQAHHRPLRAELDAAIAAVLDSCAFAGGPFVAKFEQEFAAFCGARYALGVGNGTDALWLSLLALGVGPGDEVVTVPHTFMATAEAISYCGARPVFVDVEETTQTMDPALLERAITPRTKAIIPVHLFGQMADMEAILAIAQRHGIPMVEDACQAHGARQNGRVAGTLGATGCFSFYPGKNLGAFGEAGAVITNDSELKHRIEVLRDHGQERKYFHSRIGWNARMDGIQGAVLSVKLRHLQSANDRRRANAALYDELLADLPLRPPVQAPGNHHVYHLYAVRVANRDVVLREMTAAGIGCGIHYPVPVHLQAAYQHLGYGPGCFPVAEQCASELLSLPMYPELTADQIHQVVEALKGCLTATRPHACAV